VLLYEGAPPVGLVAVWRCDASLKPIPNRGDFEWNNRAQSMAFDFSSQGDLIGNQHWNPCGQRLEHGYAEIFMMRRQGKEIGALQANLLPLARDVAEPAEMMVDAQADREPFDLVAIITFARE
jgi:hypothetical protein